MNISDYIACDGVALARLIAKREVSPLEVTDAAIAVIEARNPELNAVIATNFEAARAAAGNTPGGHLGSVPFLLKDVNLHSHDMPTRFGSVFFRNASPRPDSLMVERWRRAGLVIMGKTNTPEFAAEFVTEPRAYGVTHNPHASGLTVGGSSGGAAAAVASGMVPIAHATDLGGSIRIPAACCGVFGFKPTAGLNPAGPYFTEIAGGLNSDHVVTRSVRDSAASLDITADRHPANGSFLHALRAPVRVRVGVSMTDPAGNHAGTDQRHAVEQAARLLEQLGHEVTAYHYPDGLTADWFDDLWIMDITDLVEERVREIGRQPREHELEPLSWQLLEKARLGGHDARMAAQAERAEYVRRYIASMHDIDVLLTPSLAATPPGEGVLSFGSFNDLDKWNAAGYGFAPFSIPANIAGQPSGSCPWFYNEAGLSTGIQITGKSGNDLRVMQLCAQIEAALG